MESGNFNDENLDPEEDPVLERSTLPFPVVGVGASAGGMEAVLRLLESLPPRAGMAFVVVLHLSPNNPSTADVFFQRATRMPVHQVSDEVPIEPDHVYVIPPDRSLTMTDGKLQLGSLQRPSTHHVAIDQFFRSLGEVHRERAIAIVMSGAGADGAEGLKRVKERGGVALVQSPADAEHDSMPLNAIATGAADFVLPASDMGQKLADLWANAQRIELPSPPKDLAANPAPSAQAEQKAEQALQVIMQALRERTGHDFSHYKRATVLRRIERRMQVSRQRTIPDYADYLQSNAQEALALLKDMLISVTNFFRDRLAFEALERIVMNELFESSSPSERVRAWVAGCATGEEAYSVAMLLLEHASSVAALSGIQVFATDIDETALAVARSGIYADSIATDVPPVRLRQFFDRQPGQYVVSRVLRDKMTFSSQNLLRDPPFSRLNLVCCRNVLIYLDRPAQRQLLETFHFGLRPGGILFLGSAETADAAPELFTVIDKKNRIYRVAGTSTPRRVPSYLGGSLTYLPSEESAHVSMRRQLLEAVKAKLKAENSPPAVVVDHDMRVVYLSDQANRFMQVRSGELSAQLLHFVLEDLRLSLRAAVAHAHQTGEVVRARRVRRTIGERTVEVHMTVRPLTQLPEAQHVKGWLVVLFEEREQVASGDDGPAELRADPAHGADSEELHRQLSDAIDESDSSSEALRAANEELQSVNEELRSTTEELETSKEELQSVNEELSTVNTDLKAHLEASAKTNDDLQNFIAASELAIVFVDRGMRIQRFTPRAADIFNLLKTDVQRPLFDLTHRLDYASLEADTHEVFQQLQPIEREVQGPEGRWYLVRILPYRSSDDHIQGVVLSFIDVTERHRAQDTIRMGEEQLRLLFDSTVDYSIIMMDAKGVINSWNQGAERALGYTENEARGKPIGMIYTPEDRAAKVEEAERLAARRDGRAEDERWHLRKDGSRVYFSGVLVRLSNNGEMGYAKIARDLTQTRMAEKERETLLGTERLLRAQLQEANVRKDQFLAVVSHELKNPLNLISLAAQLLKAERGSHSQKELATVVSMIESSVKSQTQIIDDLLDLSRASTGKMTLHMERLELDQVVERIVAAVRAQTLDREVRLTVEPGDYSLLADPVRMEQIVWNLTSNAVKFTPAGGSVQVKLGSDEGLVRLDVVDTGQGIDEKFLPYVFNIFEQADLQASTRGKAGLGIGLAIVKNLTEAHAGQVSVASAGLGKGATFSVVLPRSGTHLVKQREDSTDQLTLADVSILLVDDDHDALAMFGLLLRGAGASVTDASSALEALELVKRQKFDLIVSDIGMPGMDGYALAERLRELSFDDIPKIAVTGFARPQDRDKALKAGFNEHIGKPVEYDSFIAIVARLLPLSRRKAT